MPTVPVYDSPQVAQQALPDVRQDPTAAAMAFKGNLISSKQNEEAGNALQNFGNEMQQEAIHTQLQVNAIDAKTSDTVLAGRINEITTNFKSLKGMNAVNASDDFNEQIQKAVADEKASLQEKNAGAISAFGESALQRSTFALNDIHAHSQQQTNVAALGASEARGTQAGQDFAVITGTDQASQENRATQLGIITGEVKGRAMMSGITDPTEIKILMLAETDKAVKGLVGTYIANEDRDGALGALNANKSLMTDQSYTVLKDHLNAMGKEDILRAYGQTTADKIDGMKFDTMPKAMDWIKENVPAGSKRAMVESEVQRRFTESKSAELTMKNDLVNQVLSYANKGQPLPSSLMAVVNAPANGEVLNTYRTAQHTIMERNKAEALGEKIKTDPQVYVDLMTHPEKMTSIPDNVWATVASKGLSSADMDMFTKIRASMISGKQSIDSFDPKVFNQVIGDELKQINIDPNPQRKGMKPEAYADAVGRVAAIKSTLQQAILDKQKTTGKRLDQDEMTDIVRGTFAKSINFATPKMFGLYTDHSSETTLTMKFEDIPHADVADLTQQLQKAKIPNPSHSQILQVYMRKNTR